MRLALRIGSGYRSLSRKHIVWRCTTMEPSLFAIKGSCLGHQLVVPVAAALLAFGLIACSSSGGSGGHDSGGESPEGGGEESATQYGPGETYDMVRAGARLVLRYDADDQAFKGKATNSTDSTLSRVRVGRYISRTEWSWGRPHPAIWHPVRPFPLPWTRPAKPSLHGAPTLKSGVLGPTPGHTEVELTSRWRSHLLLEDGPPLAAFHWASSTKAMVCAPGSRLMARSGPRTSPRLRRDTSLRKPRYGRVNGRATTGTIQQSIRERRALP